MFSPEAISSNLAFISYKRDILIFFCYLTYFSVCSGSNWEKESFYWVLFQIPTLGRRLRMKKRESAKVLGQEGVWRPERG